MPRLRPFGVDARKPTLRTVARLGFRVDDPARFERRPAEVLA